MLLRRCLLIAAFCSVLLLSLKHMSAEDEDPALRFERVRERVTPLLVKQLKEKDLQLGAPVFMRVFKEEAELEVWLKDRSSETFKLFKTYEIARFSGSLGPKLTEGDLQAPEGFYYVPRSAMNPQSQFHLSFNLGYPNAYDRHHERDGTFLMVHGNKISTGCFAMTDERIEEIYTVADAALKGGQKFFRVHCFPFRMTDERMEKAKEHRWFEFWENLKQGYDWFETKGLPPNSVVTESGRYAFNSGE